MKMQIVEMALWLVLPNLIDARNPRGFAVATNGKWTYQQRQRFLKGDRGTYSPEEAQEKEITDDGVVETYSPTQQPTFSPTYFQDLKGKGDDALTEVPTDEVDENAEPSISPTFFIIENGKGDEQTQPPSQDVAAKNPSPPQEALEKQTEAPTKKEESTGKDASLPEDAPATLTGAPTKESTAKPTSLLKQTDEPSLAPQTRPPTDRPTPRLSETPVPTVVLEEVVETPLPTRAPILMPANANPTNEPVESPFPTLDDTPKPTGTGTDSLGGPVEGQPDGSGSATPQPTIAGGGSSSSDVPTTPSLHTVQLDPLILVATLQRNEGTNEADFMAILVDYMEHNMGRDFEGFHSVLYSLSSFSAITMFPSSSRPFNGNATFSNKTAHFNFLMSTFVEPPSEADSVIMEYMDMLLENKDMMQEYIDSQPSLSGVLILYLNVQLDVPTNSTDGPNGTDPDSVTIETNEEAGSNNTWTIVGWTVGAFVLLLWAALLYATATQKRWQSQ